LNKIFHIGSTFKALEEGGDLHIEGMASTNNMDRVGDIVESTAWEKSGGLKNYLNNPVILFNHDYNQPIGRAVSLGTNDNGLQLKAKIAKSAGHVGDLIKEGVLGAFSVGFRVKDAEFMTETDGYKIKDAELLEVSVVTVPANQAATFSLAKSFDSVKEYEEFKKSFNTEESLSLVDAQETEQKQAENDSMPKDLSQVEVQEKTMSDIDIDAIVSAAVEKTATAMAMKEAERKAEEQKRLEAEEKAATEAAAQKAAHEAEIVTAVSSGAERLMADVEAKFAEKDANVAEIVAKYEKDLAEKSEEIQKMRESKRVFADRGEVQDFMKANEAEICDAHLLGAITRKGWDTKAGKALFEKVNTQGGVSVPSRTSEDFETVVSTSIERDIELELVIEPLFRKIQMNAASMVIPTMPDSGFAQWTEAPSDGDNANSGAPFKGNLEDKDAQGSPYTGGPIGMGSQVLTVNRLISKSYLANEAEEDAIMPILPLIREAMVRAHARAVEHSLLVGNSTDSLNDGGQNGLYKIAVDDSKVVDDGSPGQSGGNPATTAALLNMRQAMGKYGRSPQDVVYIVSLDAYYDLLDDAAFQDANLVGSNRATKLTGEIGQAYGSPILVCSEFKGGKVEDEAWGLAVNTRNFVVPVLRGVTVESDYDVENQRRVLVATQRRGFAQLFTAEGQVVAHTW